MRDYARVAPAFWTKGSGKALRGNPDAQLVGLYLVSCPSANMVGLYYLPLALMAHETGLGIASIRKALRSIETSGFAYYDEVSEYVWVPNGASYQIGDELTPGDKRQKGILRELEKFGKHAFVKRFFERYGAAYSLPMPLWIYDDDGSKHKPLRSLGNSEETHEIDHNDPDPVPVLVPVNSDPGDPRQDHPGGISKSQDAQAQAPLALVTPPPAERRANGTRMADVHAVFEVWARERKRKHPRGPSPALDDKRAEIIRDRLRDGFDVETLKLAVEGIWRSRWHLGQNDRETEYTDVRHAIGDASKVEKFAELAQKARDLAPKRGAEPLVLDAPSGTVAVAPAAAPPGAAEVG